MLRGDRGRSRRLAVGGRAQGECFRLDPADVDKCKAMEAYCGATGTLAAMFALMVGLLSLVSMIIAVIVGGEMLGQYARLRVAPDVLVLRLRLLAVVSGGLCIGGSIVGIMSMSAWTSINTALAIAYDNDGCSGPSCPHLGQSFWTFLGGITLMFIALLWTIPIAKIIPKDVPITNPNKVEDNVIVRSGSSAYVDSPRKLYDSDSSARPENAHSFF